jgi:hypothetical protein
MFSENGDDDRSSEEHLKNSKTSRGSYSDLKLPTFVKEFELYLVNQSLYRYNIARIFGQNFYIVFVYFVKRVNVEQRFSSIFKVTVSSDF